MTRTKGSVVMYSCSQHSCDVDLCLICYCNEEHRTALRPQAPQPLLPDALPDRTLWAGAVYRQVNTYDRHQRPAILRQLSLTYPDVDWTAVARQIDGDPPEAEPPPRTS